MTKEQEQYNKGKMAFSTNGSGTIGHHMQKKKKKTQKNLDTDLRSFTKINSKWIIDLNAKCKLIKLLENAMEENLDDLGYGSNLSGITPK